MPTYKVMRQDAYDLDASGEVDLAEALRVVLALPGSPIAGEAVVYSGRLYIAV